MYMMAVKITKKTYPIALACLPGGFADLGFDEVKGSYLIINELRPNNSDWDDSLGCYKNSSQIILHNSWVNKTRFFENYKFVDEELPGEFSKIKKKARKKHSRLVHRVTYRGPARRQ